MHELIARRLHDERPVRVRFDERIRDIEPVDDDVPRDRYLVPGFIDLQVNGFGGVDFNGDALSADDLAAAVDALLRHGTTLILATIVTAGVDDLCARAARLRAARDASDVSRAVVAGIHLEGPFLCPDDGPRGAHPREHCRPPDRATFDAIQHAAGGLIRLVTLAPELPGALPLIESLRRDGIVVAIGHHQADDATIDAAVRAGASLCTHLGNGSHATLPRLANYVQTQLADDRLAATFIADGFHIPQATLKNFVRAKTSARSILITDAIAPAGAPSSAAGPLFEGAAVLPDGRVVLEGTDYLAGSTLTMPAAVANAARWVGCPHADAVALATATPAAAIGRFDAGVLRVGATADLLVVDFGDTLRVRETWLAGRRRVPAT